MKNEKLKGGLKNIGMLLYTFFFFLILAEAVLMFMPRSHRAGFTLAAQIWRYNYWKPVNSLGYRDIEPATNGADIIFVGDSFTAGNGTKNAKDRFSDVIRAQAKGQSVANIGVSGADTRREFQNLLGFVESTGAQPKQIVLQYTGNDILNLAMDRGMTINVAPNQAPAPLRPLVEGSYLGNMIFWKLPSQRGTSEFINFYREVFDHPEIFTEHTGHLQQFIDYAAEHNARLTVVLIPFLQSPEVSKDIFEDKIQAFFTAQNIPVINVSELVTDMDPIDRVVNSDDAHSSVEVNKRIAEALLPQLGLN